MSHARDAFDAVLAELAADPASEFGEPGARVEILRRVDGPFSSLRRVRLDTPTRTTHAYIKILKPQKPGEDELARIDRLLRREYDATAALYRALQQDDEIGAVRPIAYLPAHRALATEEVPGQPFGERLANASTLTEPLRQVAGRIGRWVRAYQQIGDTGGRVALDERRQYLDARLALLEGRVFPAAGRAALLARFDGLARAIGSATVPAVPIHADLTPMNVVVGDSGRVTALDFTMAKTGTAYHDLSHVYFHFELMAARRRAQAPLFRALQAAMLAGYSPSLTPRDPLFRMMLLQHGVCHVALLAERRVPLLDIAYRWFLRRRWQRCDRMSTTEPALRVA